MTHLKITVPIPSNFSDAGRLGHFSKGSITIGVVLVMFRDKIGSFPAWRPKAMGKQR